MDALKCLARFSQTGPPARALKNKSPPQPHPLRRQNCRFNPTQLLPPKTGGCGKNDRTCWKRRPTRTPPPPGPRPTPILPGPLLVLLKSSGNGCSSCHGAPQTARAGRSKLGRGVHAQHPPAVRSAPEKLGTHKSSRCTFSPHTSATSELSSRGFCLYPAGPLHQGP